MKTLQQLIDERKSLHQNANIYEKLILGKDAKHNYSKSPTDIDELHAIIMDRFKNNNEYIDLSDIDISNLKSLVYENKGRNYGIKGLFYDCYSKLKKINVSRWNISDVNDISYLFFGLNQLEEIIGIEDWNVSNVDAMTQLFFNCSSLKSLNIQKWKINDDALKDKKACFGMLYGVPYNLMPDWRIGIMMRAF